MHDLALLLGRHAELHIGRIAEAFDAIAQHLAGGLSGRADDVDVAEAFFVRAVRIGELALRLFRSAARAALFLRGPRTALFLADARMCCECLTPVGLGKR